MSLSNLNPRVFIRELIVTSKCTKNSMIISLDMYDKQLWTGSKCLYDVYITITFTIKAIRKKIINVLPYNGLFFILVLTNDKIRFIILTNLLSRIKMY